MTTDVQRRVQEAIDRADILAVAEVIQIVNEPLVPGHVGVRES
jgi:hypothetical protein